MWKQNHSFKNIDFFCWFANAGCVNSEYFENLFGKNVGPDT